MNRDMASIANRNLGGTFLPWDLESFLFADTDPAITDAPARFDGNTVADDLRRDYGDFSRAAQEAQLKRLNQAAYSTYNDAGTTIARALLEHWYGGVDMAGALIGSFDDSTAPAGWRNGEVVATPTVQDPNATSTNPNTAETIYQDVFAQNCRMCHTNISQSSLRFATYQDFIGLDTQILSAVFEKGVMPGARLTADRFWTVGGGSVPQTLATELNFQSVAVSDEPQPAAEIEFVSPMGAQGTIPATTRASTIRLSAEESAFADSFNWTVGFSPPAALAGNPTVANYQPDVVGTSAGEISFLAEQPGAYSFDLTINEAGAPVAAPQAQISIPNNTPQPAPLALMLAEGQIGSLTVRDELNLLCVVPDCVEVFGDSPSSIAVDITSWDPTEGGISLDDPIDGTVTIIADQPGPIVAAIPYSVTDADGETAGDMITVTIASLTTPMAVIDNRAMDAQSTVDPPGAQSLSIAVLGNDAGDPAALPLSVDSFTQPANGSVVQSVDNLVYTPDLGFLGVDSFSYVAADSNPTGSRTSNTANVNVTVNATTTFTDAVAAFTNFNCMGCHGVFTFDWAVYATTVAQTNAPDDARNSTILVYPSTAGHGGGSPQAAWTEANDDFRWIEEGALDN